jgi:hypothetical protein
MENKDHIKYELPMDELIAHQHHLDKEREDARLTRFLESIIKDHSFIINTVT